MLLVALGNLNRPLLFVFQNRRNFDNLQYTCITFENILKYNKILFLAKAYYIE